MKEELIIILQLEIHFNGVYMKNSIKTKKESKRTFQKFSIPFSTFSFALCTFTLCFWRRKGEGEVAIFNEMKK